MPHAAPHAPAERLAGLIDQLCRAVAARSAGGWLAGPLIILIWSQLRRRAARILRLAGRIAAGQKPAPPRPRPARPPRPPSPHLPRGRAWLIRLVPEAASGAAQLQHLLAAPEMAPLLADPRMGRLVRPLCRMLGVAPPSDIARPPPPAAPAAAANPPPPRPQAARPKRLLPPPSGRPAACGPPGAA